MLPSGEYQYIATAVKNCVKIGKGGIGSPPKSNGPCPTSPQNFIKSVHDLLIHCRMSVYALSAARLADNNGVP